MSRPKLNNCDVRFAEGAHEYTLGDGTQLCGITGMIERQLFPRKYSYVSAATMDAAAERGTIIHNNVEIVDMFGATTSPMAEVQAYIDIKKQHNLVPLANEYLVTDYKHFASKIDVVYEDLSLADVKTTAKLDLEYVRWQLSIYAYLFELVNPTLTAGKLYAIWLPKKQYGKPKLKEVQRIDTEAIKALLDAEIKGQQFIPNEKY